MADPRPPDPNDEAPTVDASTASRSGRHKRIGRYTVRRVIASGGMGTVLEAIQDEPRRPVAIKVMKGGIGTPEALKRFQFEAQLLARLRHPAIAQIYEAGTHDDGSGPMPFFAMEYIPNAKSITEYAEGKRLGLRERLELFAQVCDAVHHGHQKGIIHRDIKPGNLLVDSGGAPHVIDFGVARASDSDAALPDYQTEVGQLIGSIAYMSPEQFDADPHDLDMRSDVYSLGVVLYELLAGDMPYDIKRAKIHDAARIVREVDPRKLRSVKPEAPDEVGIIVGKALEKDREQRYQSAFGLAEDIRHFLNGQPINAAPPSASYQLKSFARRQKPLLIGVGAIFTVLIAGILLASSLYVRAERQRTLAERESARAQAAIDFMTESLASIYPNNFAHEPTIGDLVMTMGERIDGAFPNDPDVEAEIRRTIAWGYLNKSDWAAMTEQLERAIELRQQADDHASEKLLDLYEDVATVYNVDGKLDKFIAARRELIRINETLWGPQDSRTLDSKFGLAVALSNAYRLGEAWEVAQATKTGRFEALGPDHEQTLRSEAQIAWLTLARGDLAEAEAKNLALLASCNRALGQSHRLTRTVQSQLAASLISQGNIVGAQTIYENRPMTSDLAVETTYQGVPELQTDTELLVFWETWCPFSQRTVPRLQEVDARYENLGVIGLTRTQPPSSDDKVRDFIAKKRLTFPVAKIGNGPWDYYEVTGTPFIVIGHEGRVIWENSMNAPEELLEGMLKGLVGASDG